MLLDRVLTPHSLPLQLVNARSVARWALICEELTLVLTVFYCFIFLHDRDEGNSLHRWTSPSWWAKGFCVFEDQQIYNSHFLSFAGDLIGGGWLFFKNWQRYRETANPKLRVAVAVSAFTILHGVGHFIIGFVLSEDFMAEVRPSRVAVLQSVLNFKIAVVFFSLGPFLGWSNGIPLQTCALVHALSACLFLEFVPTQFTFGFMQVYLNVWYCLPRALFIGTETAQEVSKRVDDSWAFVSAGFLVLTIVSFLEMLTCDAGFMSLTGHFVYDGSIVVLAGVYSAALWRAKPNQFGAPLAGAGAAAAASAAAAANTNNNNNNKSAAAATAAAAPSSPSFSPSSCCS
eukprot:CAMPEP_0206427560 /NCGR_PEP_ID=MMETSP0324_2-20121206/5110_1 /ASSEMBLY_ACC=CAM_ASM_000836 /TAXON_ID=2866 /ORGANISM="Crypthecodinium cohnii, Strain Seligo" /LENGTH=343 /DNA_ID=CAMNT_0053892857 /DNA_START=164 /DNA_END=1195 /DNA_ORIENTATION=+